MIGIYCIKNTVNKKKYVGQALNAGRRLQEHLKLLEKNKHKNEHLQNAWNKYGKNNFIFYVLEECKNEYILTEKEQFWINKYNTLNPNLGYNKKEAGARGRLSEESKEKISRKNKGKKPSKEAVKNSVLSRIGKPLSIEHKKKISDSEKGRTLSKETKEKQSISKSGINSPFLGKKHNNSTSDFYGVSFSKPRKRWVVALSVNGKRFFIGRFDDKTLAARAYNNFIIKNHLPNPANVLNKSGG